MRKFRNSAKQKPYTVYEDSTDKTMQEDLEDEVYFLARLRDRIVMQDCNILINENVTDTPKK